MGRVCLGGHASGVGWPSRSLLLFAAIALIPVVAAACGGGKGGRGRAGFGPAEKVRTALAAGGEHTCALTSAGGVKCWGDNESGQLGDGTTTERLTPVAVSGLARGVAAIAAGIDHTCALTSAGAVRCWGRNGSGELGDGTRIKRLTPIAVSSLAGGVVALALGGQHTCALTSAGAVKCWGNNESGQLGDGTTTERLTPVAVSGLAGGVAAIAAGDAHTCALTSAGGVKCWGDNTFEELGDGTATDRHTPVAVSGLARNVAAIADGVVHTCALTNAGGVKCWGDNEYGQVGDWTPTGGVAAIAAGGAHTCALTSAGGVKCWGSKGGADLRDGMTTVRHVSGLAGGVVAIAAGGEHTCALMSAGAVKCWGNNHFGELGDGTKTRRLTPVAVVGFGLRHRVSQRPARAAAARRAARTA